MKRAICAVVILFLILHCNPVIAAQLDTERELKEWSPYFGGEDRKLYFDSAYEYSRVNISSRKVDWQLYTNLIMYRIKGQLPYIEFNVHNRDRVIDETLHVGSYFKFRDSSLLLAEFGFGFDTDYIYRFQAKAEYERPLIKALHWKLGSRYLHYKAAEVLIASPGMIYYYGNHYLMADYNVSITEGRRDAHWATAKVNLELHQRVNAWFGVAAGERLFDIQTLPASEQEGFIFFWGINFRLLENMKIYGGYSYSEEQPNFIKRGFNGGLSLKF